MQAIRFLSRWLTSSVSSKPSDKFSNSNRTKPAFIFIQWIFNIFCNYERFLSLFEQISRAFIIFNRSTFVIILLGFLDSVNFFPGIVCCECRNRFSC
jgi:hypothetical protein